VSRAQRGSEKAPAKAAVAKTEAPKAAPVKAEVAAAEPPRSESAKAVSARAETSAQAEGSKGWAIQLGVFASRDNAERLAKQLKGKGYPVVVNEIAGNGKRLYRVRVGPEADRDAAVALGAKLRAAGHGGSVVPYP
jgi:DedD protein